jgi:hypothetical protein
MPKVNSHFPIRRGPWAAAAIIAVLAAAGCGSSTPSASAPANPGTAAATQATGSASTSSGASAATTGPAAATSMTATASASAANAGNAQGGCPSKTVIATIVGATPAEIEETGPATQMPAGTTIPGGGELCDYVFGIGNSGGTAQVYYGPMSSVSSFFNEVCTGGDDGAGGPCMVSQSGATSYMITGTLTRAQENSIMQAITGGQ